MASSCRPTAPPSARESGADTALLARYSSAPFSGASMKRAESPSMRARPAGERSVNITVAVSVPQLPTSRRPRETLSARARPGERIA